MPDLELSAVTDWLTTAMSAVSTGSWPDPVRPIEIDGDAPVLLAELGETLESFRDEQRERLSVALRTLPVLPVFQDVLAQLGAARQLRLLGWLAERGLPETHLITVALVNGGSPEASALRSAVRSHARRALLERLFAPERLAALQAATATAMKENA
jgi:hypothetical protein